MTKTLELTKEEVGTLKRLLREELHTDLNNVESWGLVFKEEHDKLVNYKFNLLKKLGSGETLQQIKIYDI